MIHTMSILVLAVHGDLRYGERCGGGRVSAFVGFPRCQDDRSVRNHIARGTTFASTQPSLVLELLVEPSFAAPGAASDHFLFLLHCGRRGNAPEQFPLRREARLL